jgi:hypothetical protein
MATSKPKRSKEPRDLGARTALRQGSVLPSDQALKLNLVKDPAEDELIIVVTHDCDCVASDEVEPYIELMSGKIIAASDGNYTNGKNPRKLHIEFQRGSKVVSVEVLAAPKLAIHKQDLIRVSRDATYALNDQNRRVLSVWLRSRYSRMALPDELLRRLSVVDETIEHAGKTSHYALHGIYIYCDPFEEIGPNDIYELEIFIVYDAAVQNAKGIAEMVADKIRRRFELKFKTVQTPGMGIQWTSVFLSNCVAISDITFTFADTLSFQRYQLDHISLRQDPQGSVPEAA